ncbi:MAG: DUF192 domain-containing protein [Pseudomonadota bacterium]
MADASNGLRVGGLRFTRALLVLLWLAVLSSTAFAEDMCATDSVHLRGDWGTARFTIELADEPEERAQGLMHRESMPRSAGMLFAYPEPRAIHFWMRNTLIPLDMIFLDKAGVVQKVHSNAQPLDETPIFGGNNIKYVLEVNGGLSERLGIAPGTQLRHPVIESDVAAWPCDG